MVEVGKFKNEKILIVGDLMLDRFWWGEVTRISPEAPVPVVRLESTSEALGGAANVAANVSGLGSTPILLGCIGDDAEGREFRDLLSREHLDDHCVIEVRDRPTTSKTRIVARSQHIVRVDKEIVDMIDLETEAKLTDLVMSVIGSVKCVVISDYAKGTLTERFLSSVIRAAKNIDIPIFVDPKGTTIDKYQGASLLTPNRREAIEASGANDVQAAGNALLERLSGTSILITEGEHGMTLFEPNAEPFHIDTAARDVFDVTGAGDTVAAAMAVSTANGFSLRDAVKFANEAAGLAVEHIGTTKVTLDMFKTDHAASREASRNA